MRRSIARTLLLCFALTLPAMADSPPFYGLRSSSQSGRYYVVMNRASHDKPTTVEVCERRQGAARLGARDYPPVRERFRRDPADRVISSGQVAQAPRQVYFVGESPDLLLVDRHHGVDRGVVVSFYDGRRGAQRWTLKMTQLYDVRKDPMPMATEEGAEWSAGLWLDAAGGVAWVACSDRRLWRVALADGGLELGTTADLLAWLTRAEPAWREAVFRAALLLGPAGLAERLRAILADEAMSLDCRLRSAHALRRLDQPDPAPLPLLRACLARTTRSALREMALDLARLQLGAAALRTLLGPIAADGEDPLRGSAQWALSELGKPRK